LEERVGFLAMAEVVDAALQEVGAHEVHSAEDVVAADQAARTAAASAVERIRKKGNG